MGHGDHRQRAAGEQIPCRLSVTLRFRCVVFARALTALALQWAAYFGRAVAKIDHTYAAHSAFALAGMSLTLIPSCSSRQKLMAAFDEAFHPAQLFDVSPHTAQTCLVQVCILERASARTHARVCAGAAVLALPPTFAATRPSIPHCRPRPAAIETGTRFKCQCRCRRSSLRWRRRHSF